MQNDGLPLHSALMPERARHLIGVRALPFRRVTGFAVFLSCLFPIISAPLAAQDFPTAEEAAAAAADEPLVLDDLEIVAEGLSFEQEFTLRMLRESLDKPKSQKEEDRDEWVCWVDEATGSSFNYLNCARNGDIWALQPSSMGGGSMAIGAPMPQAGYGSIMRSSRPVNRAKLRQAMDNLNGDEAFDREFITLALSGERPPRDIPDEEELDQFAKAYEELGRLQQRGASEGRQIGAIEATGLTLARYNRIAELTEVYQSIENEVAERLGR